MIIRQHVQHDKNSKKTNPIPPFPQASFLKFATLPRDRKWHISKLQPFQGRRISRMPKTTAPTSQVTGLNSRNPDRRRRPPYGTGKWKRITTGCRKAMKILGKHHKTPQWHHHTHWWIDLSLFVALCMYFCTASREKLKNQDCGGDKLRL